ncbi:MAG: hypothetical protein LAP38_08440 [Acidobacteriia bacterium]|nr:hypothetical protein [Terriglobia bacterium]
MRSGVWIWIAFSVSLRLAAQPNIASAVNAASYLTPGLPNAGIAQGSIFAIFGGGLGPAQVVQAQRLPLETQVAGTSVRISAAGTDYPVPLLYSSATAVGGVLPSSVPEGQADVIVNYDGRDSNRFTTQVRKSAFGIFTRNQAGFGPAVLQNWISGSIILNGLHQVTAAGQLAILWGTGLGAISQSDADVPPAGDLPVDVEVLVGGQAAKVLYHGRSPTYPGLDQINFEVPPGIIGCYVPLVVRAGSVMSNFASMSIVSSGTICGDDVSWRGRLFVGTAADVRVGIVEMTHEEYSTPSSSPVFWSEDGTARFFDVLWNSIDSLSRLGDLQVLPGTCSVAWNRWNNADQMQNMYPEEPNLPTVPMQAGDYLKIQGPAGKKPLDHAGPGEYEGRLGGMTDLGGSAAPQFMSPGAYTFDNLAPPPPPADASPPESYDLQASVSIPGEIHWTNKAQLTEVNRGQDLRFEWSGGVDGREYVVVGGSSADEALKTRVTFMCAQNPSAGAFTVPSWILEVLPKNSTSAPDSYPYGFLFVGSSSNNVNSLAAGTVLGTLNMLYFRYMFMYYSILDFR